MRSVRKKILKKLPVKTLIQLCNLAIIVGILGIFAIPYRSRKLFSDENAIGIGAFKADFSKSNANYALSKHNEYKRFFRKNPSKSDIQDHLISEFRHLGVDMNFYGSSKENGSPNNGQSCNSDFFFGSINSQKGLGKETIIFSFPFSTKRTQTLALLMSLTKILMEKSSSWLHLDVGILITNHDGSGEDGFSGISGEATCGEQHFLEYLEGDLPIAKVRESIVLDFSDVEFDYIALLTEGINSELPNMDFFVIVHSFLHLNKIPISIFETPSELLLPWVDRTSFFFRFVNLARNIWNQALGVGTGTHAHFRKNNKVHSLTMRGMKTSMATYDKTERFNRMGVVLESIVRCFNNLIEEFHHSYDIYFLDSPYTFIAFDDLGINIWLFLVPMIIKVVLKYLDSENVSLNQLLTLPVVIIAISSLIYLVPFFTTTFTFMEKEMNILIGWILMTCLSFILITLISLKFSNKIDWKIAIYGVRLLTFSGLLALATYNPGLVIVLTLYYHIMRLVFYKLTVCGCKPVRYLPKVVKLLIFGVMNPLVVGLSLCSWWIFVKDGNSEWLNSNLSNNSLYIAVTMILNSLHLIYFARIIVEGRFENMKVEKTK